MKENEPLTEGDRITAPFLPGPAKVKKYENRAGKHNLEVTVEETGEYRSRWLTDDQFSQIERDSGGRDIVHRDPEEFFLNVEAHRIRLAHQFDPMLAVSVSQVDAVPHQIEAVYNHALTRPRLRFMIADEAGAGKTIMAGLILKEMQARRLVQDVLIVAPGHLKYQWQREMKERFHENFRLVDRDVMRAAWSENVWQEFSHALTSVDFIKQDDVKSTLSSADWDLVIVDEAHKLNATAYETKEGRKIEKTQRYQVGELLSERTDHLLFLTATPHRGKEENFRLLLDLLRPQFFADSDLLQQAVDRNENPLFIRRLKEDMKTFDGEPIFPPRNVNTVQFRMSPPEVELYNEVTKYVKNYYDQAKENRHITFAMLILQRRLTSSVRAILSSLERRRDKLDELRHKGEQLREDGDLQHLRDVTEAELEEYEDFEEERRWEIEEKLEQITVAQNIEELRSEIRQLDGLIDLAEEVESQTVETKLAKLRDDILGILEGRKLLIFTEHKDTLWYLKERLEAWGYSVCVIHGGMSLDARVEAESTFEDEAQIMVATEAAGEGINLQFCSWMVNYDIPWNPNRLEQRMGRVHRYGQEEEVYIWNLISRNTREGQVLERLFDKLDQMRMDVGSDRVFDVIGDLIPAHGLSDLLRDAALGQRRIEDIEDQIEAVDRDRTQELLDQVFQTSLASRHIDYSDLQRETLKAEENRLVPEYVGDFFLRAFRQVGGRISPIDGGYRVNSVPAELRRLNDDHEFQSAYGTVENRYRKITFRKELAQENSDYEFVAPGHPLLEAVIERILGEYRAGKNAYAVYQDPEGRREGALWFVDGKVSDGFGEAAGRRVFALFQHPGGEIEQIHAAALWDLEPSENGEVPERLKELLTERETLENYVVGEVLFPYQAEVAEERERDAEIKRRYGLQSLNHLIDESNEKLVEYQGRAEDGADMDLAIRNERRRREDLKRRRDELKEEIRLESQLTVEEPNILGAAAVVSGAKGPEATEEGQNGGEEAEKGMTSNEEVEQVGMEVARSFEEKQGREVTDVSDKKHGGFDLRSLEIGEDGRIEDVRYIEVKARARTGAIRPTANEWKKARHFGKDYWLYVVTQASTETPALDRIQNPARHFTEGEDIFATGFQIPEERWRKTVEAGNNPTEGES